MTTKIRIGKIVGSQQIWFKYFKFSHLIALCNDKSRPKMCRRNGNEKHLQKDCTGERRRILCKEPKMWMAGLNHICKRGRRKSTATRRLRDQPLWIIQMLKVYMTTICEPYWNYHCAAFFKFKVIGEKIHDICEHTGTIRFRDWAEFEQASPTRC